MRNPFSRSREGVSQAGSEAIAEAPNARVSPSGTLPKMFSAEQKNGEPLHAFGHGLNYAGFVLAT
jgi:hypothetical protein